MRIFRFLRIILPLLILITISFFLWSGLNINPNVVPSALVGKKTPEFNLTSLNDPQKTLDNKMFLGHVSLLNVWATWCAACADEYPVLVDIKNTKTIVIYGLDYKDNRTAALNWLKNYGNAFTETGFDPDGTTAINWGVYGTPETFIIDKKGIIRYKFIGVISHEIWQRKLLPLIKILKMENSKGLS